MPRTSRTSKPATASAKPEVATPHSADAGAEALRPDNGLPAGRSRDALSLCLVQARGWFDIWQTMQEAQLRYFQDSAAVWDHALGELDGAHSLADVSTVSSQVLQSHLKNAWDNGSGALQRMMEVQAACMKRAALHWPLHPQAGLADATDAVVDSEAQANEAQLAQAAEQWQRWFGQWQQGAGEWGRAVQRTLEAAQGRV